MHWTSGRFRALGYALIVATAVLLVMIALTRPSFGRPLVGLTIVLGLVAALAIWRAQVLDERR
jgi:hypothetical protein